MKDRVDKSMGIVTRITETLVRIKPTEPLRLTKCESQNFSLIFFYFIMNQESES
jgi:hypothetical protein